MVNIFYCFLFSISFIFARILLLPSANLEFSLFSLFDLLKVGIFCPHVGFYVINLALKTIFSFVKFYWSTVDIQCCNFCCTTKWFNYTYTHIHCFFKCFSLPISSVFSFWNSTHVQCHLILSFFYLSDGITFIDLYLSTLFFCVLSKIYSWTHCYFI